MFRAAAMALSTASLVGCAGVPGPVVTLPAVTIAAPFDRDQAAAGLARGTNTITGNAFMRQQGGGVVTCAGFEVSLVPATRYATQRFQILYGNDQAGSNPGRNIRFDPDPPEYYTLARMTKCDAQGNFRFDEVADGDYLAQTSVGWMVAGRRQGGNLFQRVHVSGGRTERLVLTR